MPHAPDVLTCESRSCAQVERAGIVVDVTADTVWIRCDAPSGCALCARGLGCRGGVLGSLAGAPPLLSLPRSRERVLIGDRVTVALPAGRIGTLAAAAYGVPLAGLIVGALVSATLPALASDLGTAAGGLAGLVGGGLIARRMLLAGRALERCRPVLRVAPPGHRD